MFNKTAFKIFIALLIVTLLPFLVYFQDKKKSVAEARPNPVIQKYHPFLSAFDQDLKTNKKAGNFDFMVSSLTFDKKNRYLIVGRESGDIEIWDMANNSKRVISKAHHHRADTIQLAADGDSFFSATSTMDHFKLWDIHTGEPIYVSPPGFLSPIVPTNIPDVYVVGKTSKILFFDNQKKTLYPETYQASEGVMSLAADQATGMVAAGSASGTVDLFQINSAGGTPGLTKIKEIHPYKVGDWVKALHFSPEGDSLYSVSRSGKVDEWSIPTLEKKRSIATGCDGVNEVKILPGKEIMALMAGGTEGSSKFAPLVVLVYLKSGQAVPYEITTNHASSDFFIPLDVLMTVSGSSTMLFPLDPETAKGGNRGD